MAEYRIKDWDKNFENNRTRELKRMEFVLVPNKHDGDGFRTLISKPRGTALFGAWVLILQVASKCDPRGTLIRSDGTPHTAETIARMTGSDPRLIRSAMDALINPEIGWIEDLEANADFVTPPSRTAIARDKRRAVSRVDRYLVPERGVLTPKGKLTARPTQCQWCDLSPSPSVTGLTAILAHHVLGYGNFADDLAVMFVCRSCHGFFESGKLTTKMVIDRFGDQWAPRKVAGDSDVAACDSSAYARARLLNGTEENGTEEKRRDENAPQPGAAEPTPPSPNPHPTDQESHELDSWVHAAYERHPKKKQKFLAEQALVKRFCRDPAGRQLFDQNHLRWCDTDAWKEKHGAFAPSLHEFVADDGWKYPPIQSSKKADSGREMKWNLAG